MQRRQKKVGKKKRGIQRFLFTPIPAIGSFVFLARSGTEKVETSATIASNILPCSKMLDTADGGGMEGGVSGS